MRLGELAADRPAADDDQMLRPLGQIEYRLVGQMGHLGQARDRRNRRRRAGRDHNPTGVDPLPARLDLLRPDEAGGGADTRTPRPSKRSWESCGAIAAITPLT